MAGGRVATRTSYAEPDSDDDWLTGDFDGPMKMFDDLPLVAGAKGKAGGGKGKKRVGDTYGAGPRKKAKKSKGKGKKKATEEDAKTPFSLELLFRLPNDLFLEICGYLDGSDLLEFSRTCKTMRRTLFSSNSGYIWANSRRRDDIPLPAGMTELELAALIYSNACQVCGKEPSRLYRNIVLCFRSCSACSKEHLITSGQIRQSWPGLHPGATSCVQFSQGHCLVAELDRVNHMLLELEEEDELAEFAAQAVTSGIRTRPRAFPSSSSHLVEQYVSKMEETVAQRCKDMRAVSNSVKKKADRMRDDENARYRAQREWLESATSVLINEYGWTEAESAWLRTWGRWPGAKVAYPSKSPKEDEAAWAAYHLHVRKEAARSATNKAKWAAWNRHHKALGPLYEDYRQRTTRDQGYYPSLSDLMESPTLQPLLGPDSPSFDADSWDTHLATIERAIDQYDVEARVLAIRSILSATSNTPLSQLSRDPSEYPAAKFDDSFFKRATSTFLVWESTSGGFASTASHYRARAFPRCMQRQAYDMSKRLLRIAIDRRQVLFVRLIIKAAGLDETTAMIDDLDACGSRFRWTDGPTTRRKAWYSWHELLFNLKRYGPSNKKLKAGEVPEIKFMPGEDEDSDQLNEDDFAGHDEGSASEFDSDADSDDEVRRVERLLQRRSGDEETDERNEDENSGEEDDEEDED